MEVRWSTEAAEDFTRIILYIREHNASAAERVAHTIYDGIGALDKFPLCGRPGRVPDTRELVFAPLPFVAVYRVRESIVEVARVLHGAQRWP
jgi:toxin ParE1/3/4